MHVHMTNYIFYIFISQFGLLVVSYVHFFHSHTYMYVHKNVKLLLTHHSHTCIYVHIVVKVCIHTCTCTVCMFIALSKVSDTHVSVSLGMPGLRQPNSLTPYSTLSHFDIYMYTSKTCTHVVLVWIRDTYIMYVATHVRMYINTIFPFSSGWVDVTKQLIVGHCFGIEVLPHRFPLHDLVGLVQWAKDLWFSSTSIPNDKYWMSNMKQLL